MDSTVAGGKEEEEEEEEVGASLLFSLSLSLVWLLLSPAPLL